MTSVLSYGQPPPQPPQPPRQSPPQPPASMSAVQFLSANSSPHPSSELRPLPTHLAAASGATCPMGHPLVPDPCSNQPTCTSCQAITGALVRGQQQSLGLSEGTPTSAFYSRTDPGMNTAAKAEMLRNMAVGPYPTYSTLDPYTVYPYLSSYAGIDARRKNSMKEATNTLKAWLFEHRKNPYPTKGEKIMLAILTKMTLTQVSTWFANARRRLKKENKVTWGSDKEEDDDDDDGDGESLRRHHTTDDDKVEDGEDKEHYEDDVREDDAGNNDADNDDDEEDEINIEDEDHPSGQAPSGRPGQSEVTKVTVDSARGQDAQDGGQQGAVCLKPETTRRATYGAEENGDKSSQALTGPLTTGQQRPSHEHRLQQRHHHHDDEMDSRHIRGNGPIVNVNNAGAEPRQQRNTQKPKIWSIADVMGFKDGEQSESNNNGESSRSSSLASASASSSASPDHHGGPRNCEGRPGAVPHPHTHFPQPTASSSGSVLRPSDNKLYSLGEAQYAAQLIGGVPLNGTATYPALYSQYLQTGISMEGVYPSFLPSAYWRTS